MHISTSRAVFMRSLYAIIFNLCKMLTPAPNVALKVQMQMRHLTYPSQAPRTQAKAYQEILMEYHPSSAPRARSLSPLVVSSPYVSALHLLANTMPRERLPVGLGMDKSGHSDSHAVSHLVDMADFAKMCISLVAIRRACRFLVFDSGSCVFGRRLKLVLLLRQSRRLLRRRLRFRLLRLL